MDALQRGVPLAGLELAPLDGRSRRLPDASQPLLDGLVVDFAHDDVEAGSRCCFHDARTHQTGAHDANLLNLHAYPPSLNLSKPASGRPIQHSNATSTHR